VEVEASLAEAPPPPPTHHARVRRRADGDGGVPPARLPRPRQAAAAAAPRPGREEGGGGGAPTATAPRQVRTKVAEAYAGPAFGAMSPSPRALPLPRFPARTAADAAPGVDDAATRELRRLLGLH